MTITPDYLIERKKNKAAIRSWKLVSIFLIVAFIAVIIDKLKILDNTKIPADDYIASVIIDGILFENANRDSKLEKIADNNHIKALIVHVDSPGGTVVGSEKIYNILRKISSQKPVIIVMGTMATSGGYLISLGGDYIISHNGTITGSIGVIFQTAEVTELAERLGIKFNNFKSSELKAAPNPMEKLTPAVSEAIMENINDAYDYFVELVANRRGFTIEEAKKIADGRVYSGRRALALKLVDAIGTNDDAIKWLQTVRKIDPKLKVEEVTLKPDPKIFDMLFGDMDNLILSFFKRKLQGLTAAF